MGPVTLGLVLPVQKGLTVHWALFTLWDVQQEHIRIWKVKIPVSPVPKVIIVPRTAQTILTNHAQLDISVSVVPSLIHSIHVAWEHSIMQLEDITLAPVPSAPQDIIVSYLD